MIKAKEFRFTGTVQGVGFRPWIYLLATEENLYGSVYNDGLGVLAHVEGSPEALARFKNRLTKDIPPLASITSLTEKEVSPRNDTSFQIVESQQTTVNTTIPADAATCEDCVSELFDKKNKRWRHPFINCTHCGPRFTITRKLPYDRAQTSMAIFPMCPDCHKEYTDPLDRRFHAQPTCCPDCGPKIWLENQSGEIVQCNDPILQVMQEILSGKIVAVKGLGGFHLVCNASDDAVVERLRRLKKRPSKPFAVMGLNTESFQSFLQINPAIEKALRSHEAPIVLTRKSNSSSPLSEGIAPGLQHIGIMLPHTPIQWLLFHQYAGSPDGTDWIKHPMELFLVMTSANQGGEPLITQNEEAISQLKGIADFFLMHNRDIYIRCDDSVIRYMGENPHPIRRARGYVPKSIELGISGPSVLATGSWLKNTACLTKENRAILTQHIGDLDRAANCRSLNKAVQYLLDLLKVQPKAIACDLHPDFYSTQYAEQLAEERNIPLFRFQHHHAHIASVLASNQLDRPIIGLALDGVGLGLDGNAWGGEILKVNGTDFERIAHLSPLSMPGGDKCARQGWRLALGFLWQHGLLDKYSQHFQFHEAEKTKKILSLNSRFPQTTSLGRLFDLAASLLNICHVSSYEGEAAMRLESLATGVKGQSLLSLVNLKENIIDFAPLLLSFLDRNDTEQAAADFHATLACVFARVAYESAIQSGIEDIGMAGGCCLNQLLTDQIKENLKVKGFRVWETKNIPCNDGGLSLGQAWLAIKKLNDGV